MLRNLHLTNLPSGAPCSSDISAGHFVMATCQRTLILSYKEAAKSNVTSNLNLTGVDAYIYLLEVICGLQSKLLGENEIVSQFKDAYHSFLSDIDRDTRLQRILEKLLKDAKLVRTKYLIGIGQKTYAAIVRKELTDKRGAEKVLIYGSGQLTEDLINQLKKKANVYICARNSERVNELVQLHGIKSYPWNERIQAAGDFAYICNTIGCKHVIWDGEYFNSWQSSHTQKCFIDLGSPSVISTALNRSQDVWRLSDVLSEGAIKEERKKEQIEKARVALQEMAIKRNVHLSIKKNSKEKYLYV